MLTPTEIEILLLSAQVSGLATLLSVLPGVAVAYLLARREFPGKWLLDAAVHLPLILPPVVTGYLLLLLLGREGWVGSVLYSMGIELAFRREGAVLAAALPGFPLLVRSARIGFEMIDPGLEGAARTLGTSALRTFTRVTIPLAWTGIVAGILLAFARSLGEFGATITFAANIAGETRTLPLAIHTYLQIPGGEAAALRLTLIAIALAVGALLIGELLQRRARARIRGEVAR